MRRVKLSGICVALVACVSLTACSVTAAETADDVDAPSVAATATTSPEVATAMATVHNACPNLTPAQVGEVQGGVEDLINVNGSAQARQDEALALNNVEEFVDNFEQICGTTFSGAQRRTLVAGLNRLITN